MDLERFDGHLVQLDFAEGRIRRMHLSGKDGTQLVLTIEGADDLAEIAADYSGPLAFFLRDQRPKVTITSSVPL